MNDINKKYKLFKNFENIFLELLNKEAVLPEGVKYLFSGEHNTTVIEQKPSKRIIKINNVKNNIYFPYVVFIINTNLNNKIISFKVTLSNTPLRSTMDTVGEMPLIYNECFSGKSINFLIKNFWKINFTEGRVKFPRCDNQLLIFKQKWRKLKPLKFFTKMKDLENNVEKIINKCWKKALKCTIKNK